MQKLKKTYEDVTQWLATEIGKKVSWLLLLVFCMWAQQFFIFADRGKNMGQELDSHIKDEVNYRIEEQMKWMKQGIIDSVNAANDINFKVDLAEINGKLDVLVNR